MSKRPGFDLITYDVARRSFPSYPTNTTEPPRATRRATGITMPPNSMPRRGIGMQRSVSSRLMEAERITTGIVNRNSVVIPQARGSPLRALPSIFVEPLVLVPTGTWLHSQQFTVVVVVAIRDLRQKVSQACHHFTLSSVEPTPQNPLVGNCF